MAFQLNSAVQWLRALTFIKYLEATVRSTVISGEKQIEKVAATEQELRHLGTVKGANQRRKKVWPIMDLQEVITQLCLEPVKQQYQTIKKLVSLF